MSMEDKLRSMNKYIYTHNIIYTCTRTSVFLYCTYVYKPDIKLFFFPYSFLRLYINENVPSPNHGFLKYMCEKVHLWMFPEAAFSALSWAQQRYSLLGILNFKVSGQNNAVRPSHFFFLLSILLLAPSTISKQHIQILKESCFFVEWGLFFWYTAIIKKDKGRDVSYLYVTVTVTCHINVSYSSGSWKKKWVAVNRSCS